MPRQPTSLFWIQLIRTAAANNTRCGPARIRAALLRVSRQRGRSDVPSESTIARELRAFRQSSVQQHYAALHWPEVCARNLLPWEASPAVLALLRHVAEVDRDRPLISVALAFWRVTLARPELPIAERLTAAQWLVVWQECQLPELARALESYLSGVTVALAPVLPADSPEQAIFDALQTRTRVRGVPQSALLGRADSPPATA